MTDETNTNTPDYLGQGVRGPLWTTAGVGIGAAALYAINSMMRGFGAGGPPNGGNPPWSRDLDYERELTKANAETASLQAKLDCRTEVLAAERRFEDKLDALEAQINAQQVFNATQSGVIATINAQTQQLLRMTGLYITQPVMGASEAALNYVPPALLASKASSASTASTTGAAA